MTWSEVKKNYYQTFKAFYYYNRAVKHIRKAKKLITSEPRISDVHHRLANAYFDRAKELDPEIKNKRGIH